MTYPVLAPKIRSDHPDAAAFEKRKRDEDDDAALPKRRKRRPASGVQRKPARQSSTAQNSPFQSSPVQSSSVQSSSIQSSSVQSSPVQNAPFMFDTSSGHGQVELPLPTSRQPILVHKKPIELLHAMNYNCSTFFDEIQTMELIKELECAIELEGLNGFLLIKSVRAEADLQVDKPEAYDLAVDKPAGYKYAWLQGLINHIFIVARMCQPEIEAKSLEDRKSWCLTMADQYFMQWMLPEETNEDIDDSRVATGLLLLMAYRARYYLLEGPALKNAMMMNPPTERALRLPRPLRQKR